MQVTEIQTDHTLMALDLSSTPGYHTLNNILLKQPTLISCLNS